MPLEQQDRLRADEMAGEAAGTDVAFGWALIVAIGVVSLVGVPMLMRYVAAQLADARREHRVRRERLQEAQDEAFREELLAIVEAEQRDADAARAKGPAAE